MKKNSLLRTLTIAKGAILIPYIEAYLAAGKFPPTWEITIPNYKDKDLYYHPSSDCFTPPIDLWRARKGVAPKFPITPALRKTFDVGHMWHGYLEAIVREMGFVDEDNIELTIQQDLSGPWGNFIGKGTVDMLDVKIPELGSWLVDIKTMNKTEFEQGAAPLTFKKWEAQVNLYMDWTNFDQAFILSVCKDSPHDMREYRIQKNQGLIDEIYGRWSYAQKCLEEDVIPEDNYEVDPLLLNPGDSVLDAVIASPK